jgi:hypothetical protein
MVFLNPEKQDYERTFVTVMCYQPSKCHELELIFPMLGV